MKKIFLSVALFCLLSTIAIPFLAKADGLVPCGNPGQNACGINDFFQMLVNIYNFIALYIATPLAVIALTVGGIRMMISAGNPGEFAKGKEIVIWSIIGLFLAFASYAIINTIMTALGYSLGRWDIL